MDVAIVIDLLGIAITLATSIFVFRKLPGEVGKIGQNYIKLVEDGAKSKGICQENIN